MPALSAKWIVDAGLENIDDSMKSDKKSSRRKFFWMAQGTERKVVFITDGKEAPIIWEHQLKLGGEWGYKYTCLSMLKTECPLCIWAESNKGKFGRRKAIYFTVVDVEGYISKDGTKVTHIPYLLGAPKNVADIIRRKWMSRLENGGTLKGSMFRVYRPNSEKSCSVGEDFEFIQTVDLSQPPYSTIDYPNLIEELAPNPEGVKMAVARLKEEDANFGKYSSEEDDSVPF